MDTSLAITRREAVAQPMLLRLPLILTFWCHCRQGLASLLPQARGASQTSVRTAASQVVLPLRSASPWTRT